MPQARISSRKYTAYQRADIGSIPQLSRLSPEQRLAMQAVSWVLPFRTNNYVVDELIEWDRVPGDPIFQLSFPQPGMLAPEDLQQMVDLVHRGVPEERLLAEARRIQATMNPHPAGQMELNVPFLDGVPLHGLQHKYRETVLFFPRQGQTCHAYCSYCFRWAQFIGIEELKFANSETDTLVRYLLRHPEVSSVLFTGGDPMIMRASVLRRYIEPLLELDQLISIRIGTKSIGWWPYRFVTDSDADELIRLFDQIRQSGRHLAIMAHFSHPAELRTPAAQAAVRRLRETGAVIRCQAPLVRHVNDDPRVWAELWAQEINCSAIPYYMFIERDTGPKSYFEVTLARAYEVFWEAYRTVSGLGRTVRGPSMSATPGKVLVDGISEIMGEKVFILKFIQARNPAWVGRPFFARFDAQATWLDQLRPAFGERAWFFESEMDEIKRRRAQAWESQDSWRPHPLVFGCVEWSALEAD